MTTADIGIPGLWIKDGILYTSEPRQAVNVAKRALQEPHKMAEWKVDWWLGKDVALKTGPYTVTGAVTNARGAMLILEGASGKLTLSLVLANAALRKGDWSLL